MDSTKKSPGESPRLDSLLTFEELPKWLQDNSFIQEGYRRILGSAAPVHCTDVDVHNETGNLNHPKTASMRFIRHLWGAVVFLFLLFETWRSPSNHESVTWHDPAGFGIFLVAAVFCMGASALFHTANCHSPLVAKKCHMLDYTGIVVLTVGSFYPCVYYGFYCDRYLQVAYLVSITVAGIGAAYIVLSPGYSTPTYRWARTTVFLALGLTAIVPVLHGLWLYGFVRLRQEMGLLWLLASGALYVVGALIYAFSFVVSSQPSQCQSLTIQWTEGTGPYRLFLVPVGHVTPEIRSIVNMEIPAGQLSTNLTLRFPENSRFVAVMSDSSGFGTGGTSSIYTVGSGSSGCLPTSTKADFYMYTDSTTPSQCGSYHISWDAGVSSPVHIYGIIPGGQSFQVNTPSSGTSYDWTTNVREGTQMLFLAVGGNNENGGSTDITTVSGGSSGCINSQSPSSTASPAVGGISTIAQSAPATVVATGPAASGTATVGGSASAPVTGTNTVGETSGGSGSPTMAPTGGNGWPSTGTSPNNPPASTTTNGSGGGTVVGDPNLPAATGRLNDRERRLNLGAIIGGTLGGIALLLFLLFMWLMCKHKRDRRKPADSERLMAERRTDLLDDSVPIIAHDQGYEHDWFRAEPFIPPMSAEEFARRTGGSIGHEDQGDDYDYHQSRSSMDHAVTSAVAYGAVAHSPSRSTSGHGHRSSHSRSFSQSHSQNISHSPAHSTSRHASSHGHSRSFSNPQSFSFTPNSGTGLRDTAPLTPPTPMSVVDPSSNPNQRPPPSSWHNHASTSANVVPRSRRSGSIHEQYAQEKSGIEGEEEAYDESDMEGDIVDIPPSYASLRGPRVMNPDVTD